ncbi:hypothetical protein F5141DRAFT_1066763 [Pisolithus sp. B1]|nr:hypothetical protein F5141DRAFT_1066763 [Pisolithus sp. B1]
MTHLLLQLQLPCTDPLQTSMPLKHLMPTLITMTIVIVMHEHLDLGHLVRHDFGVPHQAQVVMLHQAWISSMWASWVVALAYSTTQPTAYEFGEDGVVNVGVHDVHSVSGGTNMDQYEQDGGGEENGVTLGVDEMDKGESLGAIATGSDAGGGNDGEGKGEADADEHRISKCHQMSADSASELLEHDVDVYSPNFHNIWSLSAPDTAKPGFTTTWPWAFAVDVCMRPKSGAINVGRYLQVAGPGRESFRVTSARTWTWTLPVTFFIFTFFFIGTYDWLTGSESGVSSSNTATGASPSMLVSGGARSSSNTGGGAAAALGGFLHSAGFHPPMLLPKEENLFATYFHPPMLLPSEEGDAQQERSNITVSSAASQGNN